MSGAGKAIKALRRMAKPAQSHIWRLLAAIVAVQGLYWLVLNPLFRGGAGPPPERAEIIGVEAATPTAPNLERVQGAEFASVTLPHTLCCEPTYGALRIRFLPPPYSDAGLGVISDHAADNFQLYLNGSLVDARGRMELGDHSFHGGQRRLIRLPSGLIHEGTNELLYVTVRQSIPYTDFRPPIVAEYAALEAWSAKRLWILNDYRQLTALCAIIVGVFALLLLWRSSEKRYAGWLLVLSFVWAAQNLYPLLAVDLPGGATARQLYYFTITNLAPVATYGFVDSWTNKPTLRLQLGLLAAWGAIAGYCLFRLWATAMPSGYDAADSATSWFMLGVSLLVAARITFHFARARDDRIVEMAILSACVATIGADAVSELIGGVPGGNMRNVTPFFLIAMVAAFVSRNFRLFRSSAAINEYLGGELAKREVELEASLEREKDHIRQNALYKERQRIMRDMHDGLGSQLVSLLAAARRGKLAASGVVEGLQSAIEELRLSVHSTDLVGESFPTALQKLRETTEVRVAQAGYQLRWRNQLEDSYPELGAQEILHLQRIVQEAVTNALKHSTGSTIELLLRRRDDGAGIEICVLDDGAGGEFESCRGMGINNMRRRSREMGAEILFQSEPGRSGVVLIIPDAEHQAELAE